MSRNTPRPDPPARRTRADQVTDAIRADIISRDLPPGQALRQEALARRYAVSRSPLREALRRLEAEGLVILRPYRGAIVAAVSDADALEVMELRLVLTLHVLQQSVPALTAADLRRAARALARTRRADTATGWGEAIDDFFRFLCAPARRPRVLALIDDVTSQSQRYRQRTFIDRSTRSTVEEWMAEVLACCRRRDADGACRLLGDHVRQGLERYRSQASHPVRRG